MEPSRKWSTGDDDLAQLSRRLPPSADALEKVLRFTLPGREPEPDLPRERSGPTARDVSHAMDLVHEAAQAIRSADERARESEARGHALLQRATEELKAAEARVQAAEARTRAAEARAQDAEARARDAEDWLRQIFAAINEELPPRR